MPRHSSFPTLFNDVLNISISNLKQWEYLKTEQRKSGTITWSRNCNMTGRINIMVNTYAESPYLELDYKSRDKPINYKVLLVTVPSNIGKGKVWYFLCPATNKLCRILYSVGGRFLHREAFTGCMYESQTYSKKNRRLFKMYEKAFGSDKLYEQLYEKHFKKTYAGKPTKIYMKLMNKIVEEGKSIAYSEKELWFLA